MNLTEEEFKEWHDHVLKERNRLKRLITDIICGVPTSGMACPYRQLTLREIKDRAQREINLG